MPSLSLDYVTRILEVAFALYDFPSSELTVCCPCAAFLVAGQRMEILTKLPSAVPRSVWVCHRCVAPGPRTSRPQPAFVNVSPSRSSQRVRGQPLHTTSALGEPSSSTSQAQPLGDFYQDLLSTPIPKSANIATNEEDDLPTFVRSGDETKEERAKKLFGSIHGSGYERRSERPEAVWQTINGVPVPPRPAEPDNCCMSGCVHCVWDDYRDDIEEWAGRLHEAQAKATATSNMSTPKVDLPRPEVGSASGSMDDDGGGSEALWTTSGPGHSEADALFAGVPVGIREFMATEKRIRERKKRRKEARK